MIVNIRLPVFGIYKNFQARNLVSLKNHRYQNADYIIKIIFSGPLEVYSDRVQKSVDTRIFII